MLLILFNGGALDISWAKWHPGVQGILEAGFPAQATGEALFDIITMHDGSVPAGRLTTTWPAGAKQVNPFFVYVVWSLWNIIFPVNKGKPCQELLQRKPEENQQPERNGPAS